MILRHLQTEFKNTQKGFAEAAKNEEGAAEWAKQHGCEATIEEIKVCVSIQLMHGLDECSDADE